MRRTCDVCLLNLSHLTQYNPFWSHPLPPELRIPFFFPLAVLPNSFPPRSRRPGVTVVWSAYRSVCVHRHEDVFPPERV